jgi:hypothetical protein
MGFLAALPGMLGAGGAAAAGTGALGATAAGLGAAKGAATLAGTLGAGKLAAGAGAAAGGGGLASLLGGGAAGGAAGGALGMLSNPYVAFGLGSMLPQLLGGRGDDKREAPDIPESFSDRQQLSTPTPNVDIPSPGGDLFRPGFSPEQRHFSGRYYSGGGMLRNFARPQMMGYGPIRLAGGGIASLAEAEAGPEAGGPPPGPEQQQLVLEAARVIKGSSDADPRMVLGQFVAAFGEDALKDLIGRVESGQMDPILEEAPPGAETAGMLEGQGDGMSDEIPATIDGQQDVLLSDGEFVIPADVVSGLGNGSSEAGARQLEAMMAKVRQSRTGTQRQAPPINPQASMPV